MSDRARRDHARQGDPPGSWRGDGDRYLSPEQNVEADRLIAELRRPEEAVTKALLHILQENTYGGRLEGLDRRLKGVARLKEKIADALESEVGSSVADAVRSISDAVRYTFSFHRDQYVLGSGDVRGRLESAGYVMIYSQNHWRDDPEYKGINTRWKTPDGGRFELQFHTFESFHAKEQLTHRSYDRRRSPRTSRSEQRALIAYQQSVCAVVPEPTGVSEIPDKRMPPQ